MARQLMAWWVGVAAGALLLIAGIGLFVLVGWATYHARRLDDPTHPYLSPPAPRRPAGDAQLTRDKGNDGNRRTVAGVDPTGDLQR
jgi:hypothetical protein